MYLKLGCLLLAALALAGPARADVDKLLSMLDQDGDGAISRAEFLKLREAMFTRLDADGSGTVTKAEIAAAQEAAAQKRRRANDPWSQDANGDGQLTLSEFTAEAPGFDRADRNGDGVLDSQELDRVARFIGFLAERN